MRSVSPVQSSDCARVSQVLAAHKAIVQCRVSWIIITTFCYLLEKQVQQICRQTCDVRELHAVSTGWKTRNYGLLKASRRAVDSSGVRR